MDLLVSYPHGHYRNARREILYTLKRLGDEQGVVERTEVKGIAYAHSAIDGREVVRQCRRLFEQGIPFEYAIKWIPVDFWCESDLDRLRLRLAEIAGPQIAADETWGMRVDRHGSQRFRTLQIVQHLARAIDRRVELDHPDKVVRVDILGERTAVSVLRPDDIFSSAAAAKTKRVPPPHVGGKSETPDAQVS